MNDGSFWTVIITAITVLGSAGAWSYYEKKMEKKQKDDDFIKIDCRDRLTKMEALLIESSKEKDEMRKTILLLTEKVAQLSVKVEFLEKENMELLQRLSN